MKKEAMIVVDYQNDFAHPKGSLYVKGGEILLPFINSLMKEIKTRSGIIITSQDWHPENHISFASTYGLDDYSIKDSELKWPKHCVADTWGADFLNGFDRDLIDRKVLKGFEENLDSFSSFGGIEKETGLNLDEILKSYNAEILHIVGLATEYCDLATILDARKLGYEVIVHTRGIKAVNVSPFDGENAIEKMRENGAKVLS
ncbi:MAG: isochorismatase family protein [Candidatus Gracilibacteria bacterium]|nr:isochorismatase family protein [Candidatus Gracilibacteria bacterium]